MYTVSIMKTFFIVLLAVLLVGVSGWFYHDHMTLSTKVTKQASVVRNFVMCTNASDKAFKELRQYKSVATCVKAANAVQ